MSTTTSVPFTVAYHPVASTSSNSETTSSSTSTSKYFKINIGEVLDKFSVKTLIALTLLCAVIFSCLIFVIVFAIQNPICVEENHEAEEAASDELQVSMSGLFQLIATNNYANYLHALDIPTVAANKIENLKTENISVEQDDARGTTITTITPWLTKSISFRFDEKFNVSYGDGESHYFCSKPKSNVINCNSFEPKRGWRIMFDYIFTKTHLINKSYFISKNVGKTLAFLVY